MDIEKFIDGLCNLSRLADLSRDLKEAHQIDEKRCGNCYLWMKSRECPREHNVNGYSRGPNMDAAACDKFVLQKWVAELKQKRIKQIEQELASLNAEVSK